MSNSKNAIQEIKSLMVKFGFLAEEVALQSFKLEDNTILQAEKLEVGKSILKINEAFEQVALQDGKYILQEHFEIEVAEGAITAVKEIFVDAKLIDGTILKIAGDTLAEGAKVVVVQEDAEIPAPDGMHELEDGTKIETKDGIIAKVEEVANDVEGGETPEAPELEVPSLAMSQEVYDMLSEFIKKMGEKMSQMDTQMSALENQFSSFKKEPAAKKVADGKTEFNKLSEDNEIDARIATIMSLKKLNNK
jgi:hypothetical protein